MAMHHDQSDFARTTLRSRNGPDNNNNNDDDDDTTNSSELNIIQLSESFSDLWEQIEQNLEQHRDTCVDIEVTLALVENSLLLICGPEFEQRVGKLKERIQQTNEILADFRARLANGKQ